MDRKEKEGKLLKWFEEELLPDLIKRGRFSDESRNWAVEKCEFEITERGLDHFASSPYFLKLVLKNEERPTETKDFYLVAKFASQDPAFRAAMKTDGQFRNEAVMYNVVLPAFGEFLKESGNEEVVNLIEELCPRSYHAEHDEENPGNSLVLLEDLRKSGFKVAESMVELDPDHCRVALNALARFHAVSLAMKIKSPEKLNPLKKIGQEIRYVDEPADREFGEKFFGVQNTRAVDYLLSKSDSEVPSDYLRKFRKLVTESPVDLMMSLVQPKEPLALMCHGDFCRNNLLFRYENGKPSEAKLFDFQTFRYAPVSHDLSFFFYMNTTLEMREKHFDELFRTYHSTLIETAGKIAGISEDEARAAFPLEKLEREYAEHAVYGYVIASFFLPCMMAPQKEVDFEENFAKQSLEEMTAEMYERGGIAATERIAEILIDFYRRKFFKNGTR